MIPYNEQSGERWNAILVLTLALIALLLYTRFASLPLVVGLLVGYLMALGLVEYLLRTPVDDMA